MERPPLIVCLWPGLARIWFRGDFVALSIAMGFAILLNLALASTFLWNQWPRPGFGLIAWPIVVSVWLLSAWVSYRWLGELSSDLPPAIDPDQDTLFIQAQSEYLKGNWNDAESLLGQRLKQRSRDVEARLLLATLMRHTRRWDVAQQQLDILNRFDESKRWRFEIDRERELLASIQEDVSDPPEPSDLVTETEPNNLDNDHRHHQADVTEAAFPLKGGAATRERPNRAA